ncbi:zinc finger protein 239-like [Betta splendens]|uniref:Zinc finger protein 239-like n=1 Tax=Betta splendens TaxID=158456 RepID=A0A6P7LZ54_BETSP|nr:zinc finger protein 239-like [Betta splendens]
MSVAADFHSQIASIMEVLANAAVAEICKVVDDGYAEVHLEMSRSQTENEFLRRKVKLLELQVARFRAERVKGGECSVSRFAGVRLLHRHSKDPLGGASLQAKTRFLTRDAGVKRSVRPDQGVDQEVVTTTKTESAEPEEELLIVKVEGAMDTAGTHHTPPLDSSGGTGGDALAALENASPGQPAGCRSETEGQKNVKNTSNPQSQDQAMEEVKEQHGLSHTLLDRQESSHSEDVELMPCSTHAPQREEGKASFNPTLTNSTSKSCTALTVHQESSGSTRDVTRVSGNSCRVRLLSEQGGGDESGEVMPLSSMRSQYQLPTCVRISEPLTDVVLDNKHNSAFNNPTADSCSLQTQHQVDNQSYGHQASSCQKQASGAAQHQQQQTSLPFACTFCPRRYAHQCHLRIHERVHTGEKPYQCSQCGKSFGQFCSLKRHQMVHTGERPFPCPHCGKQFSTSNNLKVHQSVHTGEKRFHCSKCGKNFSFHSNLIRHQALHSVR